jgi:hypothetical protein
MSTILTPLSRLTSILVLLYVKTKECSLPASHLAGHTKESGGVSMRSFFTCDYPLFRVSSVVDGVVYSSHRMDTARKESLLAHL